jgi:4-hydroxybenzoate polyprenyltransferase
MPDSHEIQHVERRVEKPESQSSITVLPPLIVDLDGTFLRVDLLHESAFRLIAQHPWNVFLFPIWLMRGRAHLKRQIADRTSHLDFSLLPFNQELHSWLLSEKNSGRTLILATASDQALAERAVERFQLFDQVIGSDGEWNLKGRRKLEEVVKLYGSEFDYAGNSRADQPLWEASREAIVVNATPSVEAAARRGANVTLVFPPGSRGPRSGIRALRLYQWVKNLLIFVPAFTSHQFANFGNLAALLATFLAFGLCASGTYVINDLFDLESDRRHARKRRRPFASGDCSIPAGLILSAVCLCSGLGIAAAIGEGLFFLLLGYMGFTLLYSLYLKRLLLVDVLTLSGLYMIRVIAGHVVTGIRYSVWLSSFVFFLFLSLAFSKRAAELVIHAGKTDPLPGRGYASGDLGIVTTAGVCSGFLSSLVLALYINSDAVQLLYHRPAFLWAILPLLLYYILRIWVVAGRGQLHDDPIIYTIKSPSTYYVAAIAIFVVFAATVTRI